MTKKGYQAIARAINGLYTVPVPSDCSLVVYRADVIEAIAGVMAADSPRFDRARFVRACETGDMRDPAKVPPPPPCVVAMGCLCAGHARNPRRKTCDTREVSR